MKDRLNTDFEHNKKAIDDLKLPISKKVRNRMAGYIVRKNLIFLGYSICVDFGQTNVSTGVYGI